MARVYVHLRCTVGLYKPWTISVTMTWSSVARAAKQGKRSTSYSIVKCARIKYKADWYDHEHLHAVSDKKIHFRLSQDNNITSYSSSGCGYLTLDLGQTVWLNVVPYIILMRLERDLDLWRMAYNGKCRKCLILSVSAFCGNYYTPVCLFIY